MFSFRCLAVFLILLVVVMSLQGPVSGSMEFTYQESEADVESRDGIELRSPGRIREGDIVRIGEDMVVEGGEVIDGSVVVVGGDLTVRGEVSEDAVCVGGDISLGSGSVIGGDIVSIGGEVSKAEGARIGGGQVDVKWLKGIPHRFGESAFPGHIFGFVGKIIRVGVLVLLSLIIAVLFPSIPTRVASDLKLEWLKSGVIGLAAEFLFVPIFIMLCITVVGIPVAFMVQPVIYILALLLGFTGVGLAIGRWVNSRISESERSVAVLVVVGVIAIELISLLGSFLRAVGAGILGWVFLTVGWIILYFAWTVGLGSAILTLFGKKEPVIVENDEG